MWIMIKWLTISKTKNSSINHKQICVKIVYLFLKDSID